MGKTFFYLFLISTSSVVTPVQGSYCSQIEDICKKKCKEDTDKRIEEAERRCAGQDVEEETIKEALCLIDNLHIQLHECEASCAKSRTKCNQEHRESLLEDKCARLQSEVTSLRLQLHQLEHKHHYLEQEHRRRKEKTENKP